MIERGKHRAKTDHRVNPRPTIHERHNALVLKLFRPIVTSKKCSIIFIMRMEACWKRMRYPASAYACFCFGPTTRGRPMPGILSVAGTLVG